MGSEKYCQSYSLFMVVDNYGFNERGSFFINDGVCLKSIGY